MTTTDDGRRVQMMHNGIKVLADGYYGGWMTRLIELCRGHHEPQEERVFHEVVKCLPPGGAMIELGGFWAFYTLWFLINDADRQALLVEPDPAHIAVGLANGELNGKHLEFVQGFVGGEPGSVREFKTEKSGPIEMPCVDVASLMHDRGLERLSILHCDVQGAEFAVLSQCAFLLRERRIDWVIVSTHHHLISGDPLTHQRCLQLLLELGGTIEAEHDVQESFSGDGFICARFCAPPPQWSAPELSYNRSSQSLFRHPLYDLAQVKAAIATREAPTSFGRTEEALRRAAYRALLGREPEAELLELQREAEYSPEQEAELTQMLNAILASDESTKARPRRAGGRSESGHSPADWNGSYRPHAGKFVLLQPAFGERGWPLCWPV